MLGNKLVQSGLYRTVILIPAALGGSSVRLWAEGGDPNAMLVVVVREVKQRYIGRKTTPLPGGRLRWRTVATQFSTAPTPTAT